MKREKFIFKKDLILYIPEPYCVKRLIINTMKIP